MHGQKTGRFIEKVIQVKSVLGQAAQVQKLDLIAQILESKRACASEQFTPKELDLKTEQKKERETKRAEMLASVQKFKGASKLPRRPESGVLRVGGFETHMFTGSHTLPKGLRVNILCYTSHVYVTDNIEYI